MGYTVIVAIGHAITPLGAMLNFHPLTGKTSEQDANDKNYED